MPFSNAGDQLLDGLRLVARGLVRRDQPEAARGGGQVEVGRLGHGGVREGQPGSLRRPRARLETQVQGSPTGAGTFATLIELVTTMSVMAILAGIAAPSFAGFIERQRASAAMSSLLTHMSLARVAAITRNRRAVLCPSADGVHCELGTDWSQGWVLFMDEDGNRMPDGSDEIVRVELEPTSRHLRVASTSGRQQLRYLPDGRSAGTNLTISICNKRNELLGQVIVNNMGRPRSERPKVPTACPA
jgi:type IV fimbrial biogenesis protein FimT